MKAIVRPTLWVYVLAVSWGAMSLLHCDAKPVQEPTQETQTTQDGGTEFTSSEFGQETPISPEKTTPDTNEPGASPDQSTPTDGIPERGQPESLADIAPQKEGWLDATALSDKRQETAVVALGEEIYIIGGISGTLATVDTVEAYNPKTQTWRKVASLPERMHHANAVAFNGKIYVLGFLEPAFSASGRSYVYDAAQDKWSSIAEMPRELRRGASTVGEINGKLYVVGGFRSQQAVSELSEYDPATDSWKALAPIPTHLDHLAGGVINGILVIAGGRHGSISSHIKETYTYDPTTNKWESKAPMPTSRGGTAAAVYKGRLYVFGGEGNGNDSSGVFAQVESFELATNQWRTHIPMKTPRHGTGAATLGDRIYIPGGASKQAFGAVDTVEIFVPLH